jgi:hypothetical protein
MTTKDEARNILAMKGAALMLDEYDAALKVANRVRSHAERITGSGSSGGTPPSLMEELCAAERLLANVPSWSPPEADYARCARDPAKA